MADSPPVPPPIGPPVAPPLFDPPVPVCPPVARLVPPVPSVVFGLELQAPPWAAKLKLKRIATKPRESVARCDSSARREFDTWAEMIIST
jgi:hypothetical protein